jgi:hypothetical protein
MANFLKVSLEIAGKITSPLVSILQRKIIATFLLH